MYDIKWIRENAAAFDRGLERRGFKDTSSRALFDLDDRRRAAIAKAQATQERRNALSKEIGKAMGAKDAALAESLKAEVAGLKEAQPALEAQEKAAREALDAALAAIPNTPFDDVPDGADEHGNVVLHLHGVKPEERGLLAGVDEPKQHFELGEALGQMDFETAARLSGARFVVLERGIARLSRAIGQFMLDTHTEEHGYIEVNPPLLVRDDAMFGTAQLPKFREDQFRAGQEHWLIPTAEVPLTNLAREQILSEEELPLRFTALTPCFRSEAGSAGRDTRGMLRQHQFEKVELVSITAPEKSREEHERMLACAEAVLKKLDLHYRVMTLCTGDMGFASRKTWDIEAWLPGQKSYREISSCSVCGDFQARRMNARYKTKDGKGPFFVHTLNGSGTAVGRALIAVMETYQNADGSITVPAVLVPYMRGVTRIERA
ncbi:serine--tRNA ligase [Bosea sp. (in: a-proteobacteria)]|uniref:serine--tRNA ligase n=1 Tax=Bosea sp. (in: a-proteobacteria) TaxID=1871050 RepID=UPI00262CCE3F|nr:serine--tRNA ligase [Bosea sp. (in: a-proteobacteria)]MCO5093064.1 serine--tRNA ligase [Bosea sp. (in: a-proteobacteria)]